MKAGLFFKGVSSIAELSKLNCGLYYGYSQIGKFLTIYPPSDVRATAITQKLIRALEGQPGPAVPFEARVGINSPVFARFGLFEWEDGSNAMLEGPNGAEEPDNREVNPTWAQPPAGLLAPKSTSLGPLRTNYLAYGFISQRGKGGVYRALDLTTVPPRHCILKEGRRDGEIDLEGSDGFRRVSQELDILVTLQKSSEIALPQIYGSFEQSGNKYLVLEWMPGGSLAERLYPPDGEPIELKAAIGLCVQVSQIIAKLHSCGWVWRDLKATNLLVDDNGNLRAIDFEGAAKCGSLITAPWGSPGHVPPEWEGSRVASFAQDLYALGAVIRHVLTREPPDKTDLSPVRRVRPEVPASIERLVDDLMHERPDDRPDAKAAVSVLAAMT
jgi:hypothetical protein